jgi:hypothetical protein
MTIQSRRLERSSAPRTQALLAATVLLTAIRGGVACASAGRVAVSA